MAVCVVQPPPPMTTTRALRAGDFVSIRGERWRIDRLTHYDAVAILDAMGCGPTNHAQQGRFLLPFERVDRPHVPSAPRMVSCARWRHVARRALADASPSWNSLRAATHANLTLFPFQLEPAMVLARGDGCRFLIADAVGLGKTVEAGLMIAETLQRRPDSRVLVISPSGLREQWRDELKQRFGLDAEILDGPGLARAAAQLPADVNPWAIRPLAIASIDYVKRPEILRSLEALTWDVLVLDEAHHLTGRSDRAAAAALLGDRARALVLLTATPHTGDDQAFARLCSLGEAGGSEPLVIFRRTRPDAGLHARRRAPLLRVRQTAAEAAAHDALMSYARLVWSRSSGGLSGARLAVSVLMRRACSSAGSLARSLERRLALLADVSAPAVQRSLPFADATGDDEEPHAVLGSAGLPDGEDERRRLEHLLGLARTAERDESKIAALRRYISRIDEPAVIFTEYRDTLQRLANALSDLDPVQLHGCLTARERADALRQFTRGAARLLLATDAGSEGLNLHQRCRLVVNLELPWTPLRLEQRTGRVDRIGQRRRVHAVHLVAAHTCEETMLARLLLRLKRMQDAMSLLARVPDEERIAESVLGRVGLDSVDGHSPIPPGATFFDVRQGAQEEASRVGLARMLSVGSRDAPATERPIIARVRRRRRTTPSQCLWVYRVVFTAAGRPIWETLLPIRAAVSGWRTCPAPLIAAALNTNVPGLQRAVGRGRRELLRQLRRSTRPAFRRWSARERDLTAGLRARHARLSGVLLQRGLFDRRNERVAAAQAATLDAVLAQSERRLQELVHSGDIRVDSSRLVFAVLLE